MRFHGALRRDGGFWVAEVPVCDALTQGRSRKEALAMIADWFVTMVDRKGFSVEVQPIGRDAFEVGASDGRRMIGLLLQRQRQRSGLSLAQVAERLGAKSRNAYARYEQGVSVPTVEKLDELLRAVAPGRDLVLQQSAA
jgi:predicted RNase H-like HicB family nuclease